MSDEVLVKVQGVSKKFCKSLKHSMLYGIGDIARDIFNLESSGDGTLRKYEFWAVDDVSFEIRRGECLGIIGPNGAGKSTLLKMLSGIIFPDRGSISIPGRVGALIELGAGFHPQLTGLENIYVNGAILGMRRKEIDQRIDNIVQFADLEDFIDTPVKFYSSGMYVRLGYAIAAHLRPDVLLIDEVLAVGDLSFRVKCMNHIQKLIESGVTVILVSHNLYQIQALANRAVVMDRGRIIAQGAPNYAVDYYEEKCGLQSLVLSVGRAFSSFRFEGMSIYSAEQECKLESGAYFVESNRPLRINVDYEILQRIPSGIQIGMLVKTAEGHRVFGFMTKNYGKILSGEVGDYTLCFEFSENLLLQGNYYLGFSTFTHDYRQELGFWEPAAKIRVQTPGFNGLDVIGSVSIPCRVYQLERVKRR